MIERMGEILAEDQNISETFEFLALSIQGESLYRYGMKFIRMVAAAVLLAGFSKGEVPNIVFILADENNVRSVGLSDGSQEPESE